MTDLDSLLNPAGSLDLIGLLPGASNYTLLAKYCIEDEPDRLVVYKPRRGETPLWDFPVGTLCHREVAAYLVCRAVGWDFVPPTVLRDGPLGIGSVQEFIDHDPSVTAFDVIESHRSELMRIVAFDVVVNNADRKAGHVFLDTTGRMHAVDHGICFNADPKLRTVMWDYIGMKVPQDDLASLERLRGALDGDLGSELAEYLQPDEISALRDRLATLIGSKVFPPPGPGRPYPWPPI